MDDEIAINIIEGALEGAIVGAIEGTISPVSFLYKFLKFISNNSRLSSNKAQARTQYRKICRRNGIQMADISEGNNILDEVLDEVL